ncbi:MAG TPA: DUF362 domain-containing protein [Smithellaceae bacterium]|nr:DUF362 domain-containing protein [Smithellaceae bacterium]
MNNSIYFQECSVGEESRISALRTLLARTPHPFRKGNNVGIKLHWGEQGNKNYLSPAYAREIVQWLQADGLKPFVVDTTVLYSGGRRNGRDSLNTAADHGFTEEYLGCPVRIGDGLDGKSIMDIPAGFNHFKTVQVAKVLQDADGFVIFSHFKGHLEAAFGGALKNISMGLASRAQKQRMHADAKPKLIEESCIKCGECVAVCPTGAATMAENDFPVYDLTRCIGCAQCIALCPETALKIKWNTDINVFQEKLVETAAAIWRVIQNKTVVINALIDIVAECDCLPGNHHSISADKGFIRAYHPVAADVEAVKLVEAGTLDQAHPNIPWQRQFEYAREIGFW